MKRCTSLGMLVPALAMVCAMGLIGCEEKGGEGALEKAGAAADDAMDQAATQADAAVDAATDAVNDAVTTSPE